VRIDSTMLSKSQHAMYKEIRGSRAKQSAVTVQRISVLVQRFNAVLLHDSLPAADCTD